MSWPENVRKSDLRIEYYRGSGKGGQHRNKRDTACRITHKETGFSSCSEEHKSQAQNRKAAFRKLAGKLVPLMKQELKGQGVEVDSTQRIRTYHFPRNEVIDVRVPRKTWNLDRILNGDLKELLSSLLKGADR